MKWPAETEKEDFVNSGYSTSVGRLLCIILLLDKDYGDLYKLTVAWITKYVALQLNLKPKVEYSQ